MRLKIANLIVVVSILLMAWPVLASAQEIGAEASVILQSQAEDEALPENGLVMELVRETNEILRTVIVALAMVVIGALGVIFAGMRIIGNSVPAELRDRALKAADLFEYLADQTEGTQDDKVVDYLRKVLGQMPVEEDPNAARG